MTAPENHKPLSTFRILCLAWETTGGTKEFVKSWDFWLSIFFVAICFPTWTTEGWWAQPLSILPNLLGFTLGGFAIFLGFGNDDFKETIADRNEVKSLYLSVSAAFLLFVAFQVAALLFALAASALWQPIPKALDFATPFIKNFGNPLCWGIGYFLFVYSLVCSLRAALRIFRVSRWYNSFLVMDAELKKSEEAQPSSSTNSRLN